MDKVTEPMLFIEDNNWQKEWKDMPEYEMDDLRSYRKIVVHFRNYQDVKAFAELIGQKIRPKEPSIWFPARDIRIHKDKRYIDES